MSGLGTIVAIKEAGYVQKVIEKEHYSQFTTDVLTDLIG